MRAPLFNLRAIAWAAGFVLVAVAMVAAAIDFGRDGPLPRPAVPLMVPKSDPLPQELTRCDALGTAAEQDAKCDAAFSESRQRFFTSPPADSGSRATQTRNHPPSKPEGR
jgi:conjugative transfer region protein TrbK